MSFIKYEYININKFSRPGIKNYGVKGLIMHYTANKGGTARNHKTYFNNLNGIYASAHLFVDDDEAICIIPFDEVAYHANDTVKYNADGTIYKPLYSKIGNANYGTIGLEMCLDKNGNITEKTFQNAVKAVKELVAKYPAITRNTIWRHYDVTGKNCPAPWVSKPSELERFKEAVFGKAGGNNTVAKKVTYQTKTGKYQALVDDVFYKEADLKNKSNWNIKKGQTIYADEVVEIKGKDGKVYTRGKVKLGSTYRYFTLRDDFVKKV